ncbi:hypothetical protein ACIBKY_50895 [Nonomuraea sp. NPDC050394]|uniref:hypothetical protein n=1 Tax=Nonomuraea sp. NPDC050394 TaxID=3364363 RepID=UPI0037B60EA9
MRTTWKVAAAAVTVAAGIGLAGLPAAASTSMGYLPSCAKVKHTTGITSQTVKVTNNCSYGVAWYVDKEGPNSVCFYTGPGRWQSHKWRKIDAYHGTFTC